MAVCEQCESYAPDWRNDPANPMSVVKSVTLHLPGPKCMKVECMCSAKNIIMKDAPGANKVQVVQNLPCPGKLTGNSVFYPYLPVAWLRGYLPSSLVRDDGSVVIYCNGGTGGRLGPSSMWY